MASIHRVKSNGRPRRRHLAFLLSFLVTSSGPAFASHELEPTQVPGQYILSLNLVHLGNSLPNWDNVPEFIKARFLIANLIANLPPAQAAAPLADDQLAQLWRNPLWREAFIQWAQTGWNSALRGLGTARVLEPGLAANAQHTNRSGTSVLLEVDPDGIDLFKASLASELDDSLATTAGEEASNFFVLQPNYILSGALEPNDPLFHAQWALDRTKVPEAWNVTLGSSDVTVAVIDSGYDPTQVELPPNLWPGNASQKGPGRAFCEETAKLYGASLYCKLTGPEYRSVPYPRLYSILGCDPDNVNDCTGHGTAMAGLIGARTNDRLRIAGTNWHVRLMILKALGGPNDRGSVFDVAEAIRFAAEHGATIISLSLGGRPPDDKPRQALLNAIIEVSGLDDQALVVVAAGNENLDLGLHSTNLFFPASFKKTHPCGDLNWCYENLVVVGATDSKDRKASFSNFGKKVVDLGAPGVAILTTGLEKDWGVAEITGTSASTALVAGAAALVQASWKSPCDPTIQLCYAMLKKQLLDGADRCRQLRRFFAGSRRLNVERAVRGLPPPPPRKCR
jgi:subtilisin family serine protease